MHFVWRLLNSNVEFYKTRSPDGASDFQSQFTLLFQGLCNINAAEDLYCNCSSSYDSNI